MFIGLIKASHIFEFSEYITYDESRRDMNWSHIYISVMLVMLGWRIYHLLISSELEYTSTLSWNYWFIGLTIVTTLSTLVHSLNLHIAIQNIITIAIVASIAWFLHGGYTHKLDIYKNLDI